MRLVAERNDWYNRYTGAVSGAASANPDLLPVGEEHGHPEHQALTQTQLDAFNGAGRHNQEDFIILMSTFTAVGFKNGKNGFK